MTLATEVDSAGARHVFPGFAVGAQQPLPAPLAAAAVELAVAAEVADVVVPTPALRRQGTAALHLPLASLSITATLRHATPAQPLFALPDPVSPGATFSIGSGVAGVRFDGGTQTLAPVFELLNVASGAGSWPVIDFSSVDKTVKQLAGVLAQIVTKALDTFFGLATLTGKETDPSAGLAALLGLTAPSLYRGHVAGPAAAGERRDRGGARRSARRAGRVLLARARRAGAAVRPGADRRAARLARVPDGPGGARATGRRHAHRPVDGDDRRRRRRPDRTPERVVAGRQRAADRASCAAFEVDLTGATVTPRSSSTRSTPSWRPAPRRALAAGGLRRDRDDRPGWRRS